MERDGAGWSGTGLLPVIKLARTVSQTSHGGSPDGPGNPESAKTWTVWGPLKTGLKNTELQDLTATLWFHGQSRQIEGKRLDFQVT